MSRREDLGVERGRTVERSRSSCESAVRVHTPTPGDAPVRRQRYGASGDRALVTARKVMRLLLGSPGECTCGVRYWDGSEDQPALGARTRFTLVIHSPGALRRMLLPPSELRLGEAYIRGDVEIDGDIEAAAAMVRRLRERLSSPPLLLRLMARALTLPRDPAPEAARPRHGALKRSGRLHSRERDRAAVRAHYDVGNEFYSLWLDRGMVYSCAYFPTGAEDIDAAQTAKLDHLCRKLRLAPGERLLDIGCGWGALVRHAAAHYGVDALGITLSERQAQLANERIRAEGLERRCRVELRDYRELPADAVFDKVVSVGMFEHVGRSQLPRYFREAARLVRPGGLFLNHGIVRAREPDRRAMLPRKLRRLLWREGEFISRYVFPDGELVPLYEAVADAERAGLETRDVEMLREHYALTLRHWVERLERARSRVEALVGEQAYRVWRLYMGASAQAFASGRISLAQILLARPDHTGHVNLPLTRADLYVGAVAPGARLSAAS